MKIRLQCINADNPLFRKVHHYYTRFAPNLISETKNPDYILLLENGYVSPKATLQFLRKNTADNILIHSECDWPFQFIRGTYPSSLRITDWNISWAYFLENEAKETIRSDRYLYSFIGRKETHACRQEVISLHSHKTPCVDISSASIRFPNFDYDKTYMQVISNSLFVLCPRGYGNSSIRIFETMRAGRVPVIISDKWQYPPVGKWDEFSIRVPESKIAEIPGILNTRSCDAQKMGRAAQDTFNHYFAPRVWLKNVISTIMGHTVETSNLRKFVSSFRYHEFRSLFQ